LNVLFVVNASQHQASLFVTVEFTETVPMPRVWQGA